MEATDFLAKPRAPGVARSNLFLEWLRISHAAVDSLEYKLQQSDNEEIHEKKSDAGFCGGTSRSLGGADTRLVY